MSSKSSEHVTIQKDFWRELAVVVVMVMVEGV